MGSSNNNNNDNTNRNNEIKRIFESWENEQLGIMGDDIKAYANHIDAKAENMVNGIEAFTKILSSKNAMDEKSVDLMEEYTDDSRTVKNLGARWRLETSNDETIGDSEFVDELLPEYEKSRQEYNVEAIQIQVDLLVEECEKHDSVLTDADREVLEILQKNSEKLEVETANYWKERDAYHQLEIEKTRRDEESLIDDYADPNLEQPSYMDPED